VVRVLPAAEDAARPRGHRVHEVNIERDEASASFVENANGGNQTVPTLLFPDGSVATNPTLDDVIERLAA
jgi:mycoredoxin